METRPFWSRIWRFPTFLGRAMKEAHAVVLSIISGLAFLVLSLLVPWFLQTHYPAFAVSIPSVPMIVTGLIAIMLTILLIGGYLTWEEDENQIAGLRDLARQKNDKKISVQ